MKTLRARIMPCLDMRNGRVDGFGVATIPLAASVFHLQIITIPELKAYLRKRSVEMPGKWC